MLLEKGEKGGFCRKNTENFGGALSGNESALAGGQTLAFMVLAMCQIVQAYNMRSERSLFAIGPFSNRNLNLAALGSTLVVVLVLFTPIRVAFGLVLLPAWMYLAGVGLCLVPLAVMELAKAVGLIKHRRH